VLDRFHIGIEFVFSGTLGRPAGKIFPHDSVVAVAARHRGSRWVSGDYRTQTLNVEFERGNGTSENACASSQSVSLRVVERQRNRREDAVAADEVR